tara:strand:- start:23 stop:400 length:378 start_codon:yes stop_codon:yes gene_type:complete
MIIVFYDGKCGLCSREIRHYIKIAPIDVFDWQDITIPIDGLNRFGISKSKALKLLHAIDENGKVHVGLKAFLLIWKHLRRWKFLAKIVSLPLLYNIIDLVYRAFASWRFSRLEHCQIALKNENKL